MERTPVSSSTINSIGYDPDSRGLEIEFTRGAVYVYHEVPQHEYENLMVSESIGRYFNANIRDNYAFSKG